MDQRISTRVIDFVVGDRQISDIITHASLYLIIVHMKRHVLIYINDRIALLSANRTINLRKGLWLWYVYTLD